VSKGEIIEHKGEGLYRVRQKLAVERIQQELTQVQARLAELAVELPTAKLELIHADDAVRGKAQEIDALIPDYAAGADGALQKIAALQAELIRLQSEARQQRLKVAELIAEDLANRKRQSQLEQVPEDRELEAWCADYTLDLDGEVGLVDINDEGGQGTLIHPGYDEAAVYDPARDGALFPNLAQSGPQIYLNAALLPGVQKWRPRYRIGTITKLISDVCNVALDPAQSSAQNLNINQAETLQQVPIKYMDCDHFAFQEGDRVLVRFTQNGPLVVGFEESPRECDVAFLCHIDNSFCSTQYDGTPFVASFFKINFGTLEMEPHAEVVLETNTLAPAIWGGGYVYEREPYFAVENWPGCALSPQNAQSAIVSGGGLAFAAETMYSQALVENDDGVAVRKNSADEPVILIFDVKTLTVKSTYEYPTVQLMWFERVTATPSTIVAQYVDETAATEYGLISFDRGMGQLASYDFGPDYYGGVYSIAAKGKYVYTVAWGDYNTLFVHYADTLALRASFNLPFGEQQVAVTGGYLILSRAVSGSPGADGRIEIFKISDGDIYELDLIKTFTPEVAPGRRYLPIA